MCRTSACSTPTSDRTKASGQKPPVNLRRKTAQRVTKIDDLLWRRTKQIVLTIVAWLAHGIPPTANLPAMELRIAEIRKRKKTDACTWLSCKIE